MHGRKCPWKEERVSVVYEQDWKNRVMKHWRVGRASMSVPTGEVSTNIYIDRQTTFDSSLDLKAYCRVRKFTSSLTSSWNFMSLGVGWLSNCRRIVLQQPNLLTLARIFLPSAQELLS
jgi:hypothetical protein